MFSKALRKSISKYNLTTFYHDLFAGFVVSLSALPLSMALSIAVGLPPEHGLYTAIVAGIVVPLLGGSNWQVTGPTAAIVVILEPIVAEFGLRGAVWSGLLAGFILILLGISKFGRFINYIPYPVSTGFAAGIAVVLATSSVNELLGLGIDHLGHSYVDKLYIIITNLHLINLYASIVGLVTLILVFTSSNFIKFLPSQLVALIAGTLLSLLFSHFGHDINTIGSQFTYTALNGELLSGIPPFAPIFHFPNFSPDNIFTIPTHKEFKLLLFPALAIAVLTALESLLTATIADNLTGTKHDPNAELSALGIGNIAAALATGLPAAGAITRTTTNINSNAKTPIAASIHAVLILVYILLISKYLNYIPMATIAALLIFTACRMSHFKQFVKTIKIAPRSDVYVLSICFLLTVFVDMVAGVAIGVICASFLVISHIASLTEVKIENTTSKLSKDSLIYKIKGPIFFGTIERVFENYNFSHDLTNAITLDFSEVPFIDMTGLVALKSMLDSIAHENRKVKIISHNPKIIDMIKQKLSDHDVSKWVTFA